MWRFLQQDYAWKQDRFIWLVSRLGDWRYGLWNEKKNLPTFFQDYTHLWVDDFDQPAGFVLSEDGDNIFFIFTAQGYEHLYSEILDWTLQHWGPRFSKLRTEVHEYQGETLDALRVFTPKPRLRSWPGFLGDQPGGSPCVHLCRFL